MEIKKKKISWKNILWGVGVLAIVLVFASGAIPALMRNSNGNTAPASTTTATSVASSTDTSDSQQAEIDSLKSQIKSLEASQKQSTGAGTVTNADNSTGASASQNSSTGATIDPSIKIQICQTQAKDHADNIAIGEYEAAANRAIAEGDSASAEIYLSDTVAPDHPADWEDNYSSAYISCLNS